MTVTVFIRYQLDPFKRDQFEQYAKNWLTIIPKWPAAISSGPLSGCRMRARTTSRSRSSRSRVSAAYEAYRARLRKDADGLANFQFAEKERFILAEERTFLRRLK